MAAAITASMPAAVAMATAAFIQSIISLQVLKRLQSLLVSVTLLQEILNLGLEGTKPCRDWSFQEYGDCFREKLKEEIRKQNFYCYTIWWKDYFDGNKQECTQDDIQEVIRLE